MATNITSRMLYEMTKTFRGGIDVWKKEKGHKSPSPMVAGARLTNPFKMGGTAYAGDLLSVNNTEKKATLLKVFVVGEAALADSTTIKLTGLSEGQFSHIPSVGDLIMKAPTGATTKGQSAKVTNVAYEGGMFIVTIDVTLGVLAKDTLLVEAAGTSASATASVLVAKVNSFVDSDQTMDAPTITIGGFTPIDFTFTPVEHGAAKIVRMTPIPEYIKASNKANYPDTYFEL